MMQIAGIYCDGDIPEPVTTQCESYLNFYCCKVTLELHRI